MSGQVSLENLIEGLAGAVVEAQRRIESRQIENLKSFFDRYNRPISMDIKVPSLNPEAKAGQDDIYRVPLLPLVAGNPLKIKEVEISFDVDLLGIADEINEELQPDSVEGDAAQAVSEKKIKLVNIDIRGNLFRKKTSSVHVVLKVEGYESEGLSRLVDRLIQTQGVIKVSE